MEANKTQRWYAPYRSDKDPLPDQIQMHCHRIQSSWSERERAERRLRGIGITSPGQINELLQWFECRSDSTNEPKQYVI